MKFSKNNPMELILPCLFSEISGDKDTIMGLPIKEIKEYLKMTK